MTSQIHANYDVHEINGNLRAFVAYDKLLVNAMHTLQKHTERLSFGRTDTGRAYWAIRSSSKHAEAFREAIARAAARAVDASALNAE